MQFSTTALLVLLAHSLPLYTQASATMALRTHGVDLSVMSKSFETDKMDGNDSGLRGTFHSMAQTTANRVPEPNGILFRGDWG